MSLLRIELVKIVLFFSSILVLKSFLSFKPERTGTMLVAVCFSRYQYFFTFLNTIVVEKWYVLTPFYMRQIIAEFSNWKPFCFCQLSRNQVEWGLLNYKFYNTTGITVYFAFCKHSDLMPLTRNKPGVLCCSSSFKSPRIQVWVMERHGKYWKKISSILKTKSKQIV